MEHPISWKAPFLSLLGVVAVEFAALYLGWHAAIPHFDVFMHLFGGATVGLWGIWLFRLTRTLTAALAVVFCGIFVGAAWEIFEYAMDMTGILSVPMSVFESIKDITVGSIGAVFATFFAKNP